MGTTVACQQNSKGAKAEAGRAEARPRPDSLAFVNNTPLSDFSKASFVAREGKEIPLFTTETTMNVVQGDPKPTVYLKILGCKLHTSII